MHSQPLLVNSKSMLKRLQAQGAIPGEEEAYLHFTLNAFKDLVSKHGAGKVISLMDEPTAYAIWHSMFITD